MEVYSVMVMADPLAPVKRYQVPKVLVRKVAWIAAGVGLVIAAALWDYWSVRADNGELGSLRVVVVEQRQQIALFDSTLATVQAELARVKELERKVRIIANLPGLAAVGGSDVTMLAPPDENPALEEVGFPAVSDVSDELQPGLPGLIDGRGGPEEGEIVFPKAGLTTQEARAIFAMDVAARDLGSGAELRAESLADLVEQLESKSHKLASMPSIWPTRGWLTSRFGYRTSPFTGRRQHHSGIDIATKSETPILAPATARVSFVGRKGPLGNAVVLDHGYGVRTFFGHTHEIHVEIGDKVDRGQLIASVGTSGRSTGPHLHYSVEIGGKAVNPMNYIFD
jgi:murein DD-endopeptidase MepM/ murein hydrolase activator NlpD